MGGRATSRVLDWLTEREPAMCDLLAQLARAESPTLVPAAQRKAFELLGQAFMALGFASSSRAVAARHDTTTASGSGKLTVNSSLARTLASVACRGVQTKQ